MGQTFTDVQPIQQAQPGQQTFENVTPIDAQQPPRGFFANLGSDLKNMVSMPRGVSPYPGMDQDAKTEAATEATQQDQGRKAAGYSLPYRAMAPVAQSIGVNVPGMEESAKQGDPAGVMGHAAAVPAALAVTRGASEAPAGKIAKSIGAVAKPFGVSAESLPVVGSIVKGVKAARNVSGELADIWSKKPPAEVAQAQGLATGAQPAVDPAAGLGNIKQPGQAGQLAAAMQQPQPAEVAPGFQRGHLQKLLNESVGAKQLDPKVSLRQQMPARSTPPTETPADLPEGHTPVQSSALKSFKYDPAAREFHAKATSGNTVYVYGDVAPEEADAFSNAESKGKAWHSIRQNPLVAKIVDGKRISVKAANPAP